MKKLIGASVYFAIGIWAAWQATVGIDWAEASRLAMAGGMVLAWSVGALLVIQWLAEALLPRWDGHLMALAQAQAVTPESELVRRMAELKPWQTEAMMRLQASLTATPGVAGAVLEYDLGGEERVPAEFVKEFMEGSQGPHLRPIRTYAEGTKGRQWAEMLTGFFVARGLARAALGNTSARWIYGVEAANRWLQTVDEGIRN